MLSGNGRHRRPRQAPALVVAAGVTGSAIAIPLIGATGASAEEAPTWDRLAACESGGLWSAHMNNGFYGGLQMTQDTWEGYGGLDYAPRADLASRSQQIAVAEKVLADQGPTAWPTCAPIAGLDGADDEGPGDTGADPEAKPSDSTEPTDDASTPSNETDETGEASDDGKGGEEAAPTGTPDASESADPTELPSGVPESGVSDEPSDEADPSTSPGTTDGTEGAERSGESDSGKNGENTEKPSSEKPSDSFGDGSWVTEPGNSGQNGTPSPDGTETAEPSPSESGGTDGSGKGRHRGDEAHEGDKDGRGSGSGRHASRDGDSSRDGGDGPYKVRAGDNLWAIADGQGVDGGWAAIYDLNKDVVGSDPDLILPGQSLDLGEK